MYIIKLYFEYLTVTIKKTGNIYTKSISRIDRLKSMTSLLHSYQQFFSIERVLAFASTFIRMARTDNADDITFCIK